MRCLSRMASVIELDSDRRSLNDIAPHVQSKAEIYFTRREAQVVALVAQDKSNKEIATRLGLSVRTVSSHLGRVFLRNRFHTRTEAALAWAKRPPRQPDSAIG